MSEAIFSAVQPPAHQRIAYGDDPAQFGDLWLPAGAGLHPLVVLVHGGFWRAKYDLEHLEGVCAALQNMGIATWNIEYRRLGNGGGWPTTFHDVGRAVDYVRTLATSYPLDLQRVVVCGHSAGGHLALWAAARERIAATSTLWQPHPFGVQAVVCLAGVSDLHQAWEQRLSQRVVEELLGGAPVDLPARYADASPAALLPLGVPQILIHGRDDGPVPFELSHHYVQRAHQAGDKALLVPLAHTRHFELIDPTTPQWQVVAAAIRGLLTL